MSYQKVKECTGPNIIFKMQFIVGLMMTGFTTTVIFTKLYRQIVKNTITFSRIACIHKEEDTSLWLTFWLLDKKLSRLLEKRAMMTLVADMESTAENVMPIPVCQNLKIDMGIENDEWPISIKHEINNSSPLWNLIKLDDKDIFKKKFEIFICFQGKNERTGTKIKMKAAYIAEEIKYCHTFL
ncbi:G protein-activated inward rectifier potassium channel 4-like [Metopolophium dirhodum]|uniref:G protein-activated inward rectifier potassium channel 4-like n=1 Tax=Metopolophium dirhodum TaxID=44670 RepID=UPI0029900E3C|nr:G protein-activated inward rectifier potassium channel 4-like [Metopolophium dirhodum]